MRYFGSGPTLVSHPGMPDTAVLAFVGGHIDAVIILTPNEDDLVGKIHVIADRMKTAFLNAALVVT